MLAESEEKLNTVENAMKYYDKRNFFLTGTRADQKRGEKPGEEDVVNEINGTETDCILSVLTSPYQEKVYRGKSSSFKCKTVVRMWNSA